MPQAPVTRLAAMYDKDTQNILDKAALRTQAFKDTFYPAAAADTRDQKVVAYERDVYDNPKAVGYNNLNAAIAFFAIQGINDFKLFHEASRTVKFVRAVVVVPVNTRTFTWPENGEVKVGTPYICVHEGRNAFRDADGNKVHLNTNSIGLRPATEQEQAVVVNGLMTVRPTQTMKNLGDQLANVSSLGEDD